MGAHAFYVTEKGRTAQEAFGALCRQAINGWGNGPYNGTISTTDLVGSPVVIAEKYSNDAERAGYNYAKEHDYGSKWESRALDLGIVKYRITTAEKMGLNGSEPKFAVRYEVEDKLYKTRKQAECAAVRIARGSGHNVSVRKIYALVSGSNMVSQIIAYTEEREELPDELPDGATIVELHMWGFYGWAAE